MAGLSPRFRDHDATMGVIETLKHLLLNQSFASGDEEEKMLGERQGSKEGVAPLLSRQNRGKGRKKALFHCDASESLQ